MQHDWFDWLGAIGGFVAGAGALFAVGVALWLATRERGEALARERRERGIEAAQRRVDEALVVLEAWERLWALEPKPWDADANDTWEFRQTPEWRASVAHLHAVLRASGEEYRYARSGFDHFGYDDAYGAKYLASQPDLGAAAGAQVYDPETDDPHRAIIRTEILVAVADARRDMAMLAGRAIPVTPTISRAGLAETEGTSTSVGAPEEKPTS